MNKETRIEEENNYCEGCENDPCIWISFGEDVCNECESWKEVQTMMTSVVVHNNECRKYCYRKFSGILHGVLGKGVRKVLPSCLVRKIRDTYSDKGSNYMGYHEK